MADDEEVIYVDELCKIIDRKSNTIRKWQGTAWNPGILPPRLLPKRGKRGWRYWTHAQIYGPHGMIAWMEKNDMRPANNKARVEVYHEHLGNLRKPKYLTGRDIRVAREMSTRQIEKDGELIHKPRTWGYIARRILPRTKYSSEENLHKALSQVAKIEGWTLVPLPMPKNWEKTYTKAGTRRKKKRKTNKKKKV